MYIVGPARSECKGNVGMRSMKVGSACVHALLRRKRCVRHRLAKGVCSLLREYARWHCWRVAITGHVINLPLTRIGNTLASMEKRAFSVYRRCGEVGG